jgi:hypothetical protein
MDHEVVADLWTKDYFFRLDASIALVQKDDLFQATLKNR